MKLKPGIRVTGLRPEILLAAIVADGVYRDHGVDLVVTSCLDGKHGRGSCHFKGLAIDLRTRDLPSTAPAESIALIIKMSLTSDYDVLVESDHIHVEFDPKDAA